jgi:hypothetical protein
MENIRFGYASDTRTLTALAISCCFHKSINTFLFYQTSIKRLTARQNLQH